MNTVGVLMVYSSNTRHNNVTYGVLNYYDLVSFTSQWFTTPYCLYQFIIH